MIENNAKGFPLQLLQTWHWGALSLRSKSPGGKLRFPASCGNPCDLPRHESKPCPVARRPLRCPPGPAVHPSNLISCCSFPRPHWGFTSSGHGPGSLDSAWRNQPSPGGGSTPHLCVKVSLPPRCSGTCPAARHIRTTRGACLCCPPLLDAEDCPCSAQSPSSVNFLDEWLAV